MRAYSFDDITGILDEFFALWAEGRDVDRRVVRDIPECLVDLLVVWELARAERLDDAVETHLTLNQQEN